MADDKTHVEVEKFTADGDVDAKFKAKAIDSMTKAAQAAIKGSKTLTLDAPKQKGAKGWWLFGNLVSLGPDKAGKNFEAKVSMSISTRPAKSMKAFPEGSGAFAIDSPDEKISPGDVDQIVTAAVRKAMTSAVPFMEKTKPQ